MFKAHSHDKDKDSIFTTNIFEGKFMRFNKNCGQPEVVADVRIWAFMVILYGNA